MPKRPPIIHDPPLAPTPALERGVRFMALTSVFYLLFWVIANLVTTCLK